MRPPFAAHARAPACAFAGSEANGRGMRTSGALKILLVGVFTLGLAVPAGLHSAILKSLGASRIDAQVWGAYVSTGLAAVGFVTLLVGLVAMVRVRAREEAWQPFVVALAPLAAEFGQGLDYRPGQGLCFTVRREGHALEVAVAPAEKILSVTSATPPRQPLAWLPRDAITEPPVKDWALVGAGRAWELRAELPATARPLLEDASLRDLMERFFSRAEALAVLHLRNQGVEVRAGIVAPERLERLIREALDVAWRVRRVNG